MTIQNPVPTRVLLKNINQFFGENPAYYAKYNLAGHNGLDIALKTGEEVVAVADGWVLEATGKTGGYGVRVTTWHEEGDNALLVVYGHLLNTAFPDWPWINLTNKYQAIKANDPIGLGDSTGDSTGPHLHLTTVPYIKQGGMWQVEFPNNGFFGAVNPLLFIKLRGDMDLYIDDRSQPAKVIAGFTCDDPDRLKWICSQAGFPLPLKTDGSPNWEHIPYSGKIQDI